MTWELRDGGLATPWWHGYLDPAEAAEFGGIARTTMLIVGALPVHLRVLPQDGAAPTVVMAHSLGTYGLVLAGLQLRLHRLGFVVVQVDLPGFGQSGGARGQVTAGVVRETLAAAVDFAAERAQGSLHLLGLGEECLAVYELCARPGIASASLHAAYDGSDEVAAGAPTGPDGAVSVAPELSLAGAADGEARAALATDPLAIRAVPRDLLRELAVAREGTAPLEASPVPVQVIASERSALLPYETAVHRFTRLRAPKDLVTLPEAYDLSLQAAFLDSYAANVARWFGRHAGPPAMSAIQELETAAAIPALGDMETVGVLPTQPVTGLDALAETQVLAIPPRTPARLRAAEAGGQPADPFVLPDGTVTIGRAHQQTLVLGDSTVSGKHAQIDWVGTHYVIADLGSTNGTYVNEERVPETPDHLPLGNGDRVRLGTVTLIFELARTT